MSKFKALVEKVLKEWDPSWVDPYKDEYKYEEYGEWLEDGSYFITKYAIFVRSDEYFGNQFACKDLEDNSWGETNELDTSDSNWLEVWNSEQDATQAMEEYKKAYPDSNPQVVEVYKFDNGDEDGIYNINKEKLVPFEEWEQWYS